MINIDYAKVKNMNMGNNINVDVETAMYAIQNIESLLYLTAPVRERDQITQETRRSMFSRQAWMFIRVRSNDPSSPFFIMDVASEFVISLERQSTDNRIPLTLDANDMNADRQWFVNQDRENNLFVWFVNNFSGKVIDNPDGSRDPGTVQIQYDDNGQDNQRFRLIRI